VVARTIGAGRRSRLLLVLGILVLVGALASGAAARQGSGKKVLRLGVSSIGDSISNPYANNSTDGTLLGIAYESLFHDNPDGSLTADLATKWHFIGGHKIFEFTLRSDARFSDGTPVTAAAVAQSLAYYAKANNSFSALLGPKPKFKAISKWTVRCTFTVPQPDLLREFSEGIVNWGFVASPKAIANPKLFDKATYGAGPYMLDYSQTVPNDHYTFKPNPYYFNKSAVKFSGVLVKVIADSSSLEQALQAGQLDIINTYDATTAPAAASAGLQVVYSPFAVWFAQLNAKESKPLADLRVRQAMNYALDRKAIANAVYGKYGTGTSQMAIMPPSDDPGMENYYKYNPAKAKQLLAAAGYPNGFDFQIDCLQQYEQVIEPVAHFLDAVGIKTKINAFSTGAAYVNQIFTFKDDSWVIAGDVGAPTTIEYGTFLAPGNAFVQPEPTDAKVNKLYFQGLKSSTPSKYWKKMWGLVVTDAYMLPISTFSDFYIASKSVTGIKMSQARPYAFLPEWSFK
jgi:peptide/nickel transport system substrate-binding protein